MAQSGDTGQNSVDTTDVFTTNDKFDTREDVLKWAEDFGIANKVSIIITRSDKKNGIRGRNDKLILGCDRGGKYDTSQSSTSTASKKCNCPFKLRATPSIDGSGWKVQVQYGVHNHGLPDQYAGHPRKARLTAEENKHVEELTKCRVAPRNIVISLKEKNPESVVDANQIYRKRNKLQKEERGSRTNTQHLLQRLDDVNFVTWNRRRDDGSNVLSDIFWAHPDSIKLLNLFPTVLTMDCTYKTNKYRLPLLEIVGTTSTNLTYNVGFAYMESEKTNNYRWALEKLKGLFTKQDILPQVIVTDIELALMNAIGFVFPHAVNLLCTWHVNKNVSSRCSVLVPKDMHDLVKKLWNNVVFSSNEVEYGLNLNEFDQACVNSRKFHDYVKNSWLNNYKERFVTTWTNKVMHLGNTMSNRAESAHWKLKQMLEHSKEHIHSGPFFQNLRSFVSRAAMTLISDEFERVNMTPGYPLPDVTLDWKKYRSPEATSWMSNLTNRLQYWRILDHSVKPSFGVVVVD
ncbi:hypothetical protein TSUD_375430 [Trifolium subterraneum]|uniref:MULE transposase domain-containing protein n=1 Tax=Trifolium subterraneum TaxID=3900 RepID=A0A2Z6P7Z9_TRISU|nr:hypothetical protein TSUD_375430 [Trifolium subterraneum]